MTASLATLCVKTCQPKRIQLGPPPSCSLTGLVRRAGGRLFGTPMPWIESHQSLRGHPKVRRAAGALGVSVPVVVGHLHHLWWWALDHAEDGDLSRFDSTDIAIGADWAGDPDKFVAALTDCGPGGTAGFLELGGLVGDPSNQVRAVHTRLHDWWDYAGKLIARRIADRARSRAKRAKSPINGARPVDGPKTVPRRSHDGPRTVLRTQPTEPTNPTSKSVGLSPTFLLAWASWRVVKGRLTTTRPKTFAAWNKALTFLKCDEAELLRRVKRFVADRDPAYLPDFSVALSGPKKGCQFTDHSLESEASQAATRGQGNQPSLSMNVPSKSRQRADLQSQLTALEQVALERQQDGLPTEELMERVNRIRGRLKEKV